MSSAPFPNIYTHRKVADTSSKGCNICYKPTTSVLITPEKQDFFYVCAIHLKDKNFATPIIDHAAIEGRLKAEAEAKKKKELDEEVERVKKEYAEKQKAKAEKEGKDKNKEEKDQEKDKAQPDSKNEETTKPEDKTKDASPGAATVVSAADEEPRVFALARSFYNQRIDKKRQIEMAKRNRERMQNPSFFPSVPKDLP
ncbi:hypothetical protein MCOR25_007481 [Pyricularia grisea]|nr:hypothetical protein MCOR25_007481 [Pyricularia grisea]